MQSAGTPLLWGVFAAIVLLSLILDFGLLGAKSTEMRTREALLWSILWVSLALVFNLGILYELGSEAAMTFFTGYLIELCLSIDNLFVFLIIFSHFGVPRPYQKKVLVYGIVGAFVMRAVFIVLGAELLRRYDFLLAFFALILIYSGVKLVMKRDDGFDPSKSFVLRIFRKLIRSTSDYREDRLFVREGGKFLATPLLLVILVVESTDVLFALDSIPAIFGITTDIFIIFTSNIFAVLGLRAFFFLLSGALNKLRFLHFGLAFVLSFVGVKMLLHQIHIEMSSVVSLLIIVGALTLTGLLSLIPEKPANPK